MTKRERLMVFFQRLSDAPAVSSAGAAFVQISELFTQVENELCTDDDDRMAPPAGTFWDEGRSREGLDVYRQFLHDTLIASNGAIMFRVRKTGSVVFEKAGADGRKVEP